MSKIKTFNVNDFDSIKDFAESLMNLDEKDANDEFLILNMKKAINALKENKETNNTDEITTQLLIAIKNLSFFCRSEKIIEEIIKEDLHSVYAKLIDLQLTKIEIDFETTSQMISALGALTSFSLLIAFQNIKCRLHEKAIHLLNHSSFSFDNMIKSNDFIYYYDTLIRFLQKNSTYTDIKEELLSTQIKSILMIHYKKLEPLFCQNKIFKYIQVNVLSTVANLLNDAELDTLPITNNVVNVYTVILNEIIENYKTNKEIVVKSKFYAKYTIHTTKQNQHIYTSAYSHLQKIISVAVNDTTKQVLFTAGIIPMLEKLLKDGNENEIEITTELLCSLCFNENVVQFIRENKNILKLIKDKQEKSKKDTTKQSCHQILKMTDTYFQRPILGKTGKHIMISYNHKYKEECLKLYDELIKRGYKVWMDVNSVFNDLHDAMAEAIESASVVLLCYSFEYKTSNNCRLEAQYAFKLNKPIIPIKLQEKYEPDGWLGMILATKLYNDLSKDINSSSTYENICKQIDSLVNKKINESSLTSYTKLPDQQARPPSSNISSALRRSESNTKNWTNEDVKNWLNNNNMASMVPVLSTASGTTMKALWEMKQKEYSHFRSTIDEMIKSSGVTVDMIHKLNFFENIQGLFN